MRNGYIAALCAVALTPLPASAQSSELARSLSELVDTAVTTSKQRKIKLELTAPLAYTPAAGPVDPANLSDPRNLDIAGVRLGMKQKDAEAALRAAGYTDSGIHDDQQSYVGVVLDRWQSRYGFKGAWNDRAPHQLIWRKGEEEITVSLVALPDGPQVNEVSYWAKDGAPISREEFTRGMLAKYGEPVNENASDLRWCTVKAPDCEDPRQATYPVLAGWPANRSLTLVGNDPGRNEALERRFNDDVERRKPADQAPSF